jgi:hypothetical protein
MHWLANSKITKTNVMRYFLLPVFIIFQLCSQAQKLIKPTKKDPPGTVRITDYKFLTPNKMVILGIGGNKNTLAFRVLETDSATIQLYLELEAGKYDVKKGEPVKIYFTDSSQVTLFAVRDAPGTQVKEGFNQTLRYYFYANLYLELSEEVQQLLINKEVESVRMTSDYMHYKLDKKKRGLIGKALQLFK